MTDTERAAACHIARVSLTTASVAEAADFYGRAFGFREVSSQRHSGHDFERLMGVDCGATSVMLELGAERLELIQFDRPGQDYPRDTAASDLVFQHFALVATDMDQAYRRLAGVPGWSAISLDGPQRLPQTAGGVTAFKFRDPEGHPLELLSFPEHAVPARWRGGDRGGPCLGIDHTAISVGDSARSVTFYNRLGLRAARQTHNHGLEQQRLDAVPRAEVEVTTLQLSSGMHLELLCYQGRSQSAARLVRGRDMAATRLVVEVSGPSATIPAPGAPLALQDPDGHRLLVIRFSR